MEKDYTNVNQQTLVSVITLMSEDYLTPVTVAAVSERLNITRDAAFRTLWNLEAAGWVEEAGGGYRIAGIFSRFADKARDAVFTLVKEHTA
jgi:DNA-binding IclR family transcriptional regulator